MPSYATPIPLTVDDTLFADKAAANHFFTHFELPEASTTEAGVVLKADALNAYVYGNISEIYVNVSGEDVPTKAAFQSMKAAVDLQYSIIVDLLGKLQAAGIMT